MNLLNELKAEREHGSNADYTHYLEKVVEEEEVELEKDIEYVVSQFRNFCTHHEHYATVHFEVISSVVKTDSVEMEIIAADEISVMVVSENIFDEEKEIFRGESVFQVRETEESKSLNNITAILTQLDSHAPAEFPEEDVPKKVIIKIHFGEDVYIKLTEELFKLEANMERNDEEYGTVP